MDSLSHEEAVRNCNLPENGEEPWMVVVQMHDDLACETAVDRMTGR